MASDKVLKFQVAIQDNATSRLEEIEKRFLGLSNQAVTVVENINKELQKIGGVSFTMPDLTKMVGQLNNFQEALSKKDVKDIPIFQSTLEQMQQLQNFIGKNTLGSELVKMKQSINSVFAEIPNVNASSFTSYFNQLSKAYNEFAAKIKTGASVSEINGLNSQMVRMGRLSGNDSLLREYQAQAEQIKSTILYTLKEVYNSINATKSLISSNALDFGKISGNIDKTVESLNRLAEAFRNFNGTIGGDKSLMNMMAGMGEVIRNVKFSMNQLEEGGKNLNLSNSMGDLAKSARDAQVEMVKLEALSEKLNRTAGQALDKLGADATTAIRQRQVGLMSVFTSLQQIANSGGVHPITGETYSQYMSKPETQAAIIRAKNEEANVRQQVKDAIKQEEQAERENERAKRQTAAATSQLIQESNGLTLAIRQSTGSMHAQSSVISDLKSMAMQYLSVWGAQQFIGDMINITGELELQQKSLEVILNNASAAQQMYTEIRDLSQTSPYKLEDLLKSHRQLAAFGIEAKDIFGTLKSLSDIGAGLDVDVSRLILAYGHTKSYGYLSGIQNRQFETAGIDLVGALTNKYNQLADAEKRAGRQAEYVTRKDIFSRMRSKSIPFEDVQSVIMDLDKPGGKFYNMQERQFETLGGKLRNLQDNYRIMMSELGGATHPILMGAVDLINNVTGNWEQYAKVLGSVAAGYATMKLASLASGKAVVAANKQIMQSAIEANRNNMSIAVLNRQDRLGYVLHGTEGRWYNRLFSRNPNQVQSAAMFPSDAEFQNLKSSKDINNITKQRIALTGKLTQAQRAELLVETGVERARAAQIAGYSGWRRGLMSVRLGMISVTQSAKAMALSLINNPIMWISAAVAAFTALNEKLSETHEQAEGVANSIKETSQTDLEGINQTLKSYSESGIFVREKAIRQVSNGEGTAIDYNFSVDKAELEAHGVASVYEDLKQQLETMSPMFDKDFFDISKAASQEEQVIAMLKKIKDIKYVKEVEGVTTESIKGAIDDTGASWNPLTWLNGESYITNISDYSKDKVDFLNAFKISDTEWNTLAQTEKSKITSLMQELSLTRNEAAAKYFKDGDVRFSGSVGAASAKGTSFKETESDAKPIADHFASTFQNYFDGNTDQMVTYFEDEMNKLFTQANIGSPETIAELSDQMLVAVRDSMIAMGNKAQAEDFFKKELLRGLGAYASKGLDGTVTQNTQSEDIPKIAKELANKYISAYSKLSPEFAKWWSSLGKKEADAHKKALIENLAHQASSIVNMEGWQKRAKFKYGIQINPSVDNDWYQFIQDKRKEIQDKAKKILEFSQRFHNKFHLDFGIELNMNASQLLKARDNINKAIHGLWGKMGKASPQQKKDLKDEINDLRSLRKTVYDRYMLTKYFEGEGFSVKDPEKENKTAERAREKAERAKEKAERAREAAKRRAESEARKADQAAIKRLQDRQRAISDMYNLYKTWYGLYHNEQGAVDEVFQRYKKDGFSKDFINQFKSLDSYKKLLERERTALKGVKFNNPSEMRDSLSAIANDYTQKISQIDSDSFKENSEKITKEMGLQLDSLSKMYDIYTKIRDLTGNKNMALSLSGIERSDVTKADLIKSLTEDKISTLLEPTGKSLDIDYNKVVGLDDANLTTYVGSLFQLSGIKAERDAIDAVVKALGNWRDAQRQVIEDSKIGTAEIIGNFSDYATKLAKLQSTYEKQSQKINARTTVSDFTKGSASPNSLDNQIVTSKYIIEDKDIREKANKINKAQFELGKLELSPEYTSLLSKNLSLSSKDVKKWAGEAIRKYMDAFKNGAMTADDYTKKVSDVRSARDTILDNNRGGFVSAFLKNGIQGILDRQTGVDQGKADLAAKEVDIRRGELEKAKEEAKKNPNSVQAALNVRTAQRNYDDAVTKVERAKQKIDADDKYSDSYKRFTETMTNVIDGLNKFNGALNLLGNVFDSLGMEGASNTMADMSTMVGGAIQGASSLSFLGPWGMAAGAGLGLLGGIAQAHDNRLERQIVALKEDVSKIEGYTQTIAKAQERTLGYDMGNVIRSYQREYNKMVAANKGGAAGKAMLDYYNAAGGGDISGYQQQFNLLSKQREDYMQMYNKENGKKKKSSSALQEYKQKIAELDDQIRYFSADMAKNLWGIDVKSWADQLSDALANAFENGENSAKAYGDTVRGILQGIASKMMQEELIEPMFNNLERKLFGDGKANKGVININDPLRSARDVSKIVSDYFGENGDGAKTITAAQEFMNAFEASLNNANLSLRNTSNSTLSSGIQGASEETTALLAGYINALRQDVSVIRIMRTQFLNEAWPDYIKQITGMATTLGRIDANVAAIRAIISENGALYQKVERLSDDLHNVIFGNSKIHIA